MKTSKEIREKFNALSGSDQELLLSDLLSDYELRSQVLENARHELSVKKEKKPCPHCNSTKVYKRGKQNNVQMYQCRECNKWYSETTGTPLWDIKLKHKWQGYLRLMQEGMSIKKIAKELEISIQTSFDWRHKILSSLSKFTPETLTDVVECDELELSLSKKGQRGLDRKPRKRGSDFKRNAGSEESTVVQVVTAVDRKGQKYLKAVESKRLTSEQIKEVFEGKLAENATLITDKHPSYKKFARGNKKLSHKTVLAKDHVDKQNKNIHLQHVNNTHSQLRGFLRPFNGVSSKYLQNYLNWFAYKEKMSGTTSTLKQWFIAILTSPLAYQLFLQFKLNAVNIRT